ncbi:flagellar hook-associated protein FlgK [bacterium]|nr:flagellar hook-associated protein FlgK [bacterium]
MSGTGRILDIARRALAAQEAGLNVASHNIANVNTPGYSRQRAVFAPSRPDPEQWGIVGTGVDVQTIQQIRDKFIDTEIHAETQTLGQWQYKERVFGEIEVAYNEPSDTGLSAVMRDFFDSWGQLANDPDSSSSRERVRQTGIQLANKFQHLNRRLTNLQGNLNQEFDQSVSEFNTILQQVADLNERIVLSESRGVTANDYRDRRTYVLEKLNELADVAVNESSDGNVTVTLDGNILVERDNASTLGIKDRSLGYLYVGDPVVASSDRPVKISDGKMKGILDMRDEIIPHHLETLDDLVNEIVDQVNTIHSAGFDRNSLTGRNFFNVNTSGAGDVEIDSAVLASINNIAASSDGSAGDGNTALDIGKIEESKVLEDDTVSANDFFAALIGGLGVYTQESSFMRENQELMVEQLKHQQDSIAGVSLDEEMTNLIKYQHAYQAAARLVKTVDEMMETLVNMV